MHEENTRNIELYRANAALREALKENALLAAENSALRTKRFVRFNNEECWIYDYTGDNHLESLVCPVVIGAPELSRLLKIEQAIEFLPLDLRAAQPDPEETGYLWDVNDCVKWLHDRLQSCA